MMAECASSRQVLINTDNVNQQADFHSHTKQWLPPVIKNICFNSNAGWMEGGYGFLTSKICAVPAMIVQMKNEKGEDVKQSADQPSPGSEKVCY
jgi:hypothetical protein